MERSFCSDLYFINLSETFVSIQGESTYAGFPCFFVRLAGCNLRCSYCDTVYARSGGDTVSIEAVLENISRNSCRLVQITGGEPLLQKATPILVSLLLEKDYKVLVETNGSIDINLIDPRAKRIVDFKTPSSDMVNYNNYDNIKKLTSYDEVKFVVATYEDYLFGREIMRDLSSRVPDVVVNFSPVFEKLSPKQLAEWILEDGLYVRLNLQLQKYIWAPDLRGV